MTLFYQGKAAGRGQYHTADPLRDLGSRSASGAPAGSLEAGFTR